MTLNTCYNLGVATSFEKKDVPVTMKIASSVRDTIEQIGLNEDRPIGYVARELMLRGLALYKRDGLLRDPENGLKVVRVPHEGDITDEIQTRNAASKATASGARKKKAAR